MPGEGDPVQDPEDRTPPGPGWRWALSDAFHQAPLGMAVTAVDGTFEEVNAALGVLLGRDPSELPGTSVDEALLADDAVRLRADRERVLGAGEATHQARYRARQAQGQVVSVSLSLAPLRDPSGVVTAVVVLAEDVTALEQQEVELAHRALHDPLTGLPNRVLFADRLQHALARLRREDSSLALLFVDIDGFKTVNDRFGHEEGDRVLAEAARRLAGAVRPGDTAARFGGDEFVVLCEKATREEADAVARRVVERWLAPVVVGNGESIVLTCSIGVAVTDSAATSPDTLLREADASMYRDKRRRPTS